MAGIPLRGNVGTVPTLCESCGRAHNPKVVSSICPRNHSMIHKAGNRDSGLFFRATASELFMAACGPTEHPGQELPVWTRSEARHEQFSWDQRMPRVGFYEQPCHSMRLRQSIPSYGFLAEHTTRSVRLPS
jgi:hypothetical protein